MNSVCLQCQTWKTEQNKLLESCESIFDVCSQLETFEKDCIKTCPYSKEIVDTSSD